MCHTFLSIIGFYYTALTFSVFYDLIGYSLHFPLACSPTNLQGRYRKNSQLKCRILKRSKQYNMLALVKIHHILTRCCSYSTRTRTSLAVGGKEQNTVILHFNKFSLVAQSCQTLCNTTDYSMPGFTVHHQLPELTQTHVHQVCDAIQQSPSVVSFFSCLQSFPASESFQMS